MGAGYSIKAKANAEAEIFIYEDVGAGFFGGVTAKQFAADLKAMGKVETINLHLNSAGGDVFDGLAIYRLLVDHPAAVAVHVDGLAASIASVIAMAGNTIRIAESGFLMIHDAWGLVIGGAEDMRTYAALLDTTSGSIADVYVARTKNKLDKVRGWMKDETWFTASDAAKEGFADEVAENLKVAAHVDTERHKFKRAPAALTAPIVPAGRPLFDSAAARLAALRTQIEQRRINKIRAA